MGEENVINKRGSINNMRLRGPRMTNYKFVVRHSPVDSEVDRDI